MSRGAVADSSEAEGEIERSRVRRGVVRPAGGVAERKVGEQESRHADVLDDILRAADHDAWRCRGLERARDQAQRLVADRAVRRPGSPRRRVARQRATISGASTSSVVRWLRLVGAPWKRAATAPIRPAAAARAAGSGN